MIGAPRGESAPLMLQPGLTAKLAVPLGGAGQLRREVVGVDAEWSCCCESALSVIRDPLFFFLPVGLSTKTW